MFWVDCYIVWNTASPEKARHFGYTAEEGYVNYRVPVHHCGHRRPVLQRGLTENKETRFQLVEIERLSSICWLWFQGTTSFELVFGRSRFDIQLLWNNYGWPLQQGNPLWWEDHLNLQTGSEVRWTCTAMYGLNSSCRSSRALLVLVKVLVKDLNSHTNLVYPAKQSGGVIIVFIFCKD